MAFWRPSTMDSWNIFSKNFWTVRNLFGQSDYERVIEVKRRLAEALRLNQERLRQKQLEEAQFKQLKATRLVEASAAVESGDDTALRDPVTMEIIDNPVITTRGGVYDRDSLAECLRRNLKDPLTNLPITPAQIKPFPEFKIHIDAFHERRRAEEEIARAQREAQLPQVVVTPTIQALPESVSSYPFGITYAVYSGICSVLSGGYLAVSRTMSYCNPLSLFGRVASTENVSQTLLNEYRA